MFQSVFLKNLRQAYNPERSGISENVLRKMNSDVDNYVATIPVSVAEFILVKSELAASTAIAKAERTNRLNADQIRQVRKILEEIGGAGPKEFLRMAKKQLTTTTMGTLDAAFILRDALEQYGIFAAFRDANAPAGPLWTRKTLDMQALLSLHAKLTDGLDSYKHLEINYNPYRPGKLRGINSAGIKVGDYIPPPIADVPALTAEILEWARNIRTVHDVWFFVNTLYAIHPFGNGNKRTCRILEHALLRDIGMNKRGIYNLAQVYRYLAPPTEKETKSLDGIVRKKEKKAGPFDKYLLGSLYKPDMTIMAEFQDNALVNAIALVYVGINEKNRADAMERALLSARGPAHRAVVSVVKKHIVKSKAVQTKVLVADAVKAEKNLSLTSKTPTASERTVFNVLDLLNADGVIGRARRGRPNYVFIAPLISREEHMIRDIYSGLGTTVNKSLVPEQLKESVYFSFEQVGSVTPDMRGISKVFV